MRVMFDVTDPDEKKQTKTERKKAEVIDVKALLAGDDAFIRRVVRAALQEVPEAAATRTGRTTSTAIWSDPRRR